MSSSLAEQAGIRCVVVLGSYFALSAPGFDVMFLELPYIFGSMSGRKPLWVPLVL